MAEFKNPYISRVQIKNFRNFLDVDVILDHKQVIIGENNVGKTNFLRAIQLILDKDFSDNDRQLSEDDFHDSLIEPMKNGKEILIIIQLRGYEHNSKLMAQFSDAVIEINPATIQFTYKYFPNRDEFGNILNYKFEIYKGNGEEKRFISEDRNFINIYVIKALRDVERELKSNRNSPLYKLVKQYEISKDSLEEISTALKNAADGILELDEIIHIRNSIQDRFETLSGLQQDHDIALRTFDIDTERLLYTLQVYMGIKERPVSELSLGLANILYISLMLILLKDRTILPIIKNQQFQELIVDDESELLLRLYDLSENDNYILKKNISPEDIEELYSFMDEHNYAHQTFTILAVEEPEAHLHPVLQRLIYREVLHSSSTSVMFTTHSTFITSVAPLKSVVHVQRVQNASKIFSTANLKVELREQKDIERYIDAKRGEIYFGKGIILCEGITEEYLLPASADLLGNPLDDHGIIVCNIDSTNFKPYVKLLDALNIPWVILTDGDYYEIETINKNGEDKKIRKYHIISSDADPNYRGNEIIEKLLVEMGLINIDDIPEDFREQDKIYMKKGCFIGSYTLEVDMMEQTNDEGLKILKLVYSELKQGGEDMQNNFETAINNKDYWKALNKIENNISKGRFAQRLASELIPELIPKYIKQGISHIVKIVKKEYE